MENKRKSMFMCILRCEEACDPDCSMYSQCWDEEEINKKKNEQDN
jgi:hypothetical protein